MKSDVPTDVAEWMLAEFERSKGYLDQEDVVYRIQKRSGERFVYQNQNGNLAVGRAVLTEFRKLTEEFVVWERGERVWRRREKHDPLGKRQAE